ncbi:MAG: GxxExxY protein [Candidatus Parcubacteria bacterium]|nr:GxxExxY protein [Candidatus Parcubacteria bacterium]
MGEYLYEELTYKIIGSSFDVIKQIGYGYREKIYQRALSEEFGSKGLKYKRECPIKIYYRDKVIGKYYLDFVVDDKIVVELKVANNFYVKDIKQVLSYMKANDYKLGLLIIITKDGVRVKRLIN